MNAQERFTAARIATVEGRHEEALRELIWFHHNALKENPALYAVRLSFGLGAWMDLGEVYPEALRALERIRDQSVTELLQGESDAAAFHDVAAINELLGTSALTHQLFLRLAQTMPVLARACARFALPAIVEARDYRLAEQLLPTPEIQVPQLARILNAEVRRIKNRPYTGAPTRWACIRNYVGEIQRTLTVLLATGATGRAGRVKALAIGLIQSPSVRRDVEAEFIRPADAPAPRLRRHRRRS